MPRTSYRIPPACHVDEALTCCSSQICQCEGVECVVETNAHFAWVDLISNVADPSVVQITEWEQNADDGWFSHLPTHCHLQCTSLSELDQCSIIAEERVPADQ